MRTFPFYVQNDMRQIRFVCFKQAHSVEAILGQCFVYVLTSDQRWSKDVFSVDLTLFQCYRITFRDSDNFVQFAVRFNNKIPTFDAFYTSAFPARPRLVACENISKCHLQMKFCFPHIRIVADW